APTINTGRRNGAQILPRDFLNRVKAMPSIVIGIKISFPPSAASLIATCSISFSTPYLTREVFEQIKTTLSFFKRVAQSYSPCEPGRLGIRELSGPSALAGEHASSASEAGSRAGWSWENRLAYFPPYLLDYVA